MQVINASGLGSKIGEDKFYSSPVRAQVVPANGNEFSEKAPLLSVQSIE